jgi:hypothetical protein
MSAPSTRPDTPEGPGSVSRAPRLPAGFEAKPNALPRFTTEIDGLDLHFIHVRSPLRAAFRTVR